MKNVLTKPLINKFCEWVLTQPVEEDNYEKSLEEMKEKGLYK